MKSVQFGFAPLSATALSPFAAFAQAKYPERPIKLMIPFSAGGVTDIVGRHWAERMKAQLGTIYVENQGGAGGTIGASEVRALAADGHTILLGNTSVDCAQPDDVDASCPTIRSRISCRSRSSAWRRVASVVHAVGAGEDAQEFVAYAKANPGKLSYGSAGTGTMTHLAAEQFKQLTGLQDLTHVPYKGAGPGIADLVSGHIPAMTPNITGQVLEFHKAGKVRILAVFAPQRLKGAPEIPTAIELGFPNMVGQLFVGVFAPSATPKPIVEQIAAANHKVMADAAFQKILIDFGPRAGQRHAGSGARPIIGEETARWAPVVKAIGLKME